MSSIVWTPPKKLHNKLQIKIFGAMRWLKPLISILSLLKCCHIFLKPRCSHMVSVKLYFTQRISSILKRSWHISQLTYSIIYFIVLVHCLFDEICWDLPLCFSNEEMQCKLRLRTKLRRAGRAFWLLVFVTSLYFDISTFLIGYAGQIESPGTLFYINQIRII